jgi:hypothetical protein
MKPDVFIINGNEIIGSIYNTEKTKVVLMNKPTVDLNYGLKFVSVDGKSMSEPYIEQILVDMFLDRK